LYPVDFLAGNDLPAVKFDFSMLHFVHLAELGEAVFDAVDFAVAVGELTGWDRAADALAHFGKLRVGAGRFLVADAMEALDSLVLAIEAVKTREEPFHWEMDSVVSAREGGSKKRFLTMTERMTRADLVFLMPDGTMASVVEVLDQLEKKLGTANFRRIFSTITVDNGSEFQDWEGMMRTVNGNGTRTHIYYCHPYSAFERGSNENGNRMIRRKVPKGTDFTGITEDDAKEV